MMKLLRRTTCWLALVAGLAAPPGALASDSSATEGAARVQDAPVPKLDWAPCDGPEDPSGIECATAEVPLSYADPDGQSIEIALGRLPATDQEHKLGSLFWNPGGPGGSGRIPFELSPELSKRFDIIGFDPRGVGDSSPVRCFESDEQALRLFGRPFATTAAQEEKYVKATERGTDLCARNGGPLLSHVSTANVARDLDLLRQSVGDEQLNYLGYSYGSHIGEVYANLFPDKVRAMTLDGIIDPLEWTTGRRPGDESVPVEYRVGSYAGGNQALQAFFDACSADERCAFRETDADLREKYDSLLESVKETPLEVDDGAGGTLTITYQDVVYLTLEGLYFAGNSVALGEMLEELYGLAGSPQGGDLQASRRLTNTVARARELGVTRGPRASALGIEWLPMVECVDSNNPTNPWEWPRFARRADGESPFGSAWIYQSMACATWPADDVDRYTGPWDRQTANPVLLIGNSQGDPATPYEDAQSTAGELANARLLTLDSFGHTAQGGLSKCIDDAVDRYMIDGVAPPAGTVCKPDSGPFDTVAQPTAERLERRAEALGQSFQMRR